MKKKEKTKHNMKRKKIKMKKMKKKEKKETKDTASLTQPQHCSQSVLYVLSLPEASVDIGHGGQDAGHPRYIKQPLEVFHNALQGWPGYVLIALLQIHRD